MRCCHPVANDSFRSVIESVTYKAEFPFFILSHSKVHISDSTFALLEGAFPVEPGQTNAVLKRFGVVKTYFIVPRPNCEKICSGSVDSLDSEVCIMLNTYRSVDNFVGFVDRNKQL